MMEANRLEALRQVATALRIEGQISRADCVEELCDEVAAPKPHDTDDRETHFRRFLGWLQKDERNLHLFNAEQLIQDYQRFLAAWAEHSAQPKTEEPT